MVGIHLDGPLGMHSGIVLESGRKEKEGCWHGLSLVAPLSLVKRPLVCFGMLAKAPGS